MIFFCEDCGAKNQLETADRKDGKAVFQCCSCQYRNSYAIAQASMPLDSLLKTIGSAPGIIGAFLYHVKTRCITNHMPDILKEADLKVLADYLTRSYLAARSSYSDIHGAAMVISNKHITIQEIEPSLFLFVVNYRKPFQKEKSMIRSEDFLQISKIKGVDQYIFVDHTGQIAGHDISDPPHASKMVFSCGQTIQTIGKNKFRYAIFSRENNKNMMIFPVGTYFLGVKKQKEADTRILADLILNSVEDYLKQIGPSTTNGHNGYHPKD